jgi:hypothetical protein
VIPAPAVLRGWLARLVLAVALPAAVLTAARLLQLQSAHLPENVGALLPWLPYLLLGPGLLLALLFGRGRAFFLLLLLAGFYWVLSQPLGWRVHGARLDADALRLGLACLLPLNVAAFAWLGERGVFTRHGALRCAGVLLQIGLLAVLATSRPHLVTAPLQASPLGLPTTLVGGLLGEPAWLAIVLGAVLLLLRFVLSRESFAFDLVGVLVALGLLLRFASEPAAVALYATAAGLLVLVAIVRDSHRMAFRDELTGLPGRRALQQELPKLGSRYAIAMLEATTSVTRCSSWSPRGCARCVAAGNPTATAARSSPCCSRARTWTRPGPTWNSCARRSPRAPSTCAASSGLRSNAASSRARGVRQPAEGAPSR